MWCRRNFTSLTRRKTRTRKRIHISLFKQHSLRRRRTTTTTTREKEDTLSVAVISIGQESVLTASSHRTRNQPML
jgi:hypothetical protein